MNFKCPLSYQPKAEEEAAFEVEILKKALQFSGGKEKKYARMRDNEARASITQRTWHCHNWNPI